MFKLIIIDFSVVVNTVALSFSIVFFSNSINQAWLNIVLYSLALSMSLGLDVFKYSKRIYLAIMSHRNAQWLILFKIIFFNGFHTTSNSFLWNIYYLWENERFNNLCHHFIFLNNYFLVYLLYFKILSMHNRLTSLH